MTNFELIEKMMATRGGDQETPEDSCLRLVCCMILQVSHFIVMKQRLKKPFNPILGETFEYVTDKFRFFSEQVSHHPPVTAFDVELEGLRI